MVGILNILVVVGGSSGHSRLVHPEGTYYPDANNQMWIDIKATGADTVEIPCDVTGIIRCRMQMDDVALRHTDLRNAWTTGPSRYSRCDAMSRSVASLSTSWSR